VANRDRPSDVTFAAGFDIARRLRDPDFRAFLKASGWTSGQHIIMAADTEPVVDVIRRMMLHDTHGRVFIAIPNDQERFGFRVLVAAPAQRRPWWRRARKVERVQIAREASIGMLYDSLKRCGEYMPTEWNRTLKFERVPTAA
jgi:hypothetical protein